MLWRCGEEDEANSWSRHKVGYRDPNGFGMRSCIAFGCAVVVSGVELIIEVGELAVETCKARRVKK